jgi:hypothetical protein
MKRINLIISLGINIEEELKNIQKLLLLVCQQDYTILDIHFNFDNFFCKKDIMKIIDLERKLGRNYSIIFKNTICCKSEFISKSIVKLLSKYSFSINILLENYSLENSFIKKLKRYASSVMCTIEECSFMEARDTYLRIKGCTSFLCFNKITGSVEDKIIWFNEWLLDKEDININIFDECLLWLLFKTNNRNCKNNSCLGKALYMNAIGHLSFCGQKKETEFLVNIANVNVYEDIFNNDTFIRILETAKTYRSTCKNNCMYFDACQGGCPLEITNSNILEQKCKEEDYIQLLKHIDYQLVEILAKGNLQNINPALKRIILNSLVFCNNEFDKYLKKAQVLK